MAPTLAVEKHGHAMNFSLFALTPAETGLGWLGYASKHRKGSNLCSIANKLLRAPVERPVIG